MSMFPVLTPEKDFTQLSKLIYGLPKTGKTTLASLLIDGRGKPPAFITTEKGHGALTVNAIRVTSWLGFAKLVNDIKSRTAELQADHSCFVIDLVSDIDDMAAQYICEKNHISALGDLEHGKGWFMHKTAFRNGMNALLGVLPCTFICHSELKEDIKTKVTRMDPAMGKQCAAYVNGKVDIIMWIEPAGGTKNMPQVIIRPTIALNAGSRFPQLVRSFDYDPKNPPATITEMSKVFAERLGDETTVATES